MADYITETEVEQFLGVTLTSNGQNTFNLMLPLMQDMIDQYCERTWNFTNPVTEYFDAFSDTAASYPNTTYFPKYPISKTAHSPSYPLAEGIRSVTIGDTAFDMNYVYSYGTHLKLGISPHTISLSNPYGRKSVKIVYNSDDAGNPPKAVKLAFIEWMARKIQTAPDAGRDVTQTSAGTVSVSYRRDKKGELPDFVKMVLDHYRLPSIDRS